MIPWYRRLYTFQSTVWLNTYPLICLFILQPLLKLLPHRIPTHSSPIRNNICAYKIFYSVLVHPTILKHCTTVTILRHIGINSLVELLGQVDDRTHRFHPPLKRSQSVGATPSTSPSAFANLASHSCPVDFSLCLLFSIIHSHCASFFVSTFAVTL
jgi:hypothetical protein